MANYPASLPQPQVEGYQVEIDYGIRNTLFENGNRRQRKVFQFERTVVTMTLVLSSAQLWTWQKFANDAGYDWHYMDFPSQYSGRPQFAKAHLVRYIGDISITAIDPRYYRVTLQAEVDMTAVQQSAAVFSGNWVISDRTAALLSAEETLVAGSPRFPAADI